MNWTLYDGLGKFEGEHYSVPDFWDQCLEFGPDDEAGPWFFVKLTPADIEKYPELSGLFGLAMTETEQGFVNVEWFESAEEYANGLARAEENSQDDSEGY